MLLWPKALLEGELVLPHQDTTIFILNTDDMTIFGIAADLSISVIVNSLISASALARKIQYRLCHTHHIYINSQLVLI